MALACCKCDPDGTKVKALISDPGGAVVNLSRCGDSYLVHWAYRTGTDGATIWRINADGSNRQQVGSGKSNSAPACSPDHKWIYYLDTLARQMRVPTEGDGAPEVVRGTAIPDTFEYLGNIDFSPDGQRFMFVAMTMTPDPNRQMRSNLVVASVEPSEGATPSVLVHDQRFSAGVTATSIYTGHPGSLGTARLSFTTSPKKGSQTSGCSPWMGRRAINSPTSPRGVSTDSAGHQMVSFWA